MLWLVKIWQVSSCGKLGTLRSNDATKTRTSRKKYIYVLSVFMAMISTYFVKCRRTSLFEFQGTISKFRKRNKISSFLVYVLHKTRNLAFSRRSRAKTAKKCTKTGATRASGKLLFCSSKLLGTLSSENVAKKMNLRSFKFSWCEWGINCVYLVLLNMSNSGDFSWSWILKGFIQVQKEEGKIRRRMSTSSIKRQIRRSHVVVACTGRQRNVAKCSKKPDVRAQLLFW